MSVEIYHVFEQEEAVKRLLEEKGPFNKVQIDYEDEYFRVTPILEGHVRDASRLRHLVKPQNFIWLLVTVCDFVL